MNKIIIVKSTLRRKMSCRKCRIMFSLFNWKLKCCECEGSYCSKCLLKQDGVVVCDVCAILIKRPVNRILLLQLKSKDLQDYLTRHNISTYGVVEKQELVEVLCRSSVPVRQKKNPRKFPPLFGGSVPNLAARSQTYLNNLRSNAEAALQNHSRNAFRTTGHQSATNSPVHMANIPTPTSEQIITSPSSPQPTTSAEETTSPLQEDIVEEAQEAVPEVPLPESSRKFPEISDYEHLEDLDDLTGKQLKELLALNRVDYKGCVEKKELVERAQRLWNDYHKNKVDELSSGIDLGADTCKICMDAPLDCVLLECGHIATCITCGKQLAECPICRQYVSRVVRTFKA